MFSRWIRAAGLLLALLPAAALAFEAVDSIRWPPGRFPAYPGDPVEPWGYWAQAGVLRDWNVLRLPDNERSETIFRYGAGIRGDARIVGRQRLLLEAVGEYYDYNNFSVLDHFAYGVRGEWLWELGNQLSGTAGYRREKRLADIGEVQRVLRDMITIDRFYASGAYAVMPDWRLTGGAEYFHIAHSGRAIAKADGNMVRAGIDHLSPLGNTIGVEARRSRGEAPVVEELGLGAFPDNEFEERELAATLSYNLGPTLRVAGRIGRTTRTYTELEGRDFKGTTGRGTVEWIATPKTALVVDVYREPTAVVDADALHVVRRGLSIGPNWAPTIKLVFSARYVNERRSFQGDPRVEFLGATQREETVRIWRLGVGWEPRRRWQLSTAVDYGDRESNTLSLAGIDRSYKYLAVMLNAKFSY